MNRGTALAETAITVALALLIIFNAAELALLGFYQLHADAAAYFTARYEALSTNPNPEPSAQAALSTALPPAYPSGNVSISKQPSYAQSVAQQNWAGLLMMPGFTASTTVYGSHIEPYPATANLQPVGAFSYGIVTAQLQNYYDATGQPGVYPQTGNLGLALVDPTANGNGSNGIFHYFSDHDRCYQRLITSFPSNSMPAPNSYDPANQRYEATIYGWDTGVNGTC